MWEGGGEYSVCSVCEREKEIVCESVCVAERVCERECVWGGGGGGRRIEI